MVKERKEYQEHEGRAGGSTVNHGRRKKNYDKTRKNKGKVSGQEREEREARNTEKHPQETQINKDNQASKDSHFIFELPRYA